MSKELGKAGVALIAGLVIYFSLPGVGAKFFAGAFGIASIVLAVRGNNS